MSRRLFRSHSEYQNPDYLKKLLVPWEEYRVKAVSRTWTTCLLILYTLDIESFTLSRVTSAKTLRIGNLQPPLKFY